MKLCGKPTLKVNYFFPMAHQNSRGVLMAYLRSKSFTVKNHATNCSDKILIVDTTIDNKCSSINSYNASNEQEQVNTLANLQCIKYSTKTNPKITILEILVCKIQPEKIKSKIFTHFNFITQPCLQSKIYK